MRNSKDVFIRRILISCMLLFLSSFSCLIAQTENKTALLLIDIQNDYFPGGKMELVNSEIAGSNAYSILKKFRKDKLPVVFIQHISNYDGATFFIPKTEGVEINKCVSPLDKEIVIKKNYPNSFKNTDLLDVLHEMNIKKLVICGMMTHMCVDATVRAAKDLEFNCVLIGDACATRNLEYKGAVLKSEDVQSAFLSALNNTYAKVVNTNDFLSLDY